MIPAEYEEFEKVVTVGCVNFAPVWGNKDKTLAKIEAMPLVTDVSEAHRCHAGA